MKRIEFIAPVESMRGNLSGKQELVYAQNDNPAFDAPEGRQYARNYSARYIGAKRSKDLLKYFQVRRKSATFISDTTKAAMAAFGGAAALVAVILKDKTSYLYTQFAELMAIVRRNGFTGSMRQYITEGLVAGLRSKMQNIIFEAGLGQPGTEVSVIIANPWVATSMTDGAKLTDAIRQKFWLLNGINTVIYKIAGAVGKLYAHVGESFASIVHSDYNFLNLEEIEEQTAGGGTVDVMGITLEDGSIRYLNRHDVASGVDFTVRSTDVVDLSVGSSYFLGSYITTE